MKTFFKSILAVAVCASLFAACSKDDTVSDPSNGRKVTMTVTASSELESASGSRTTYDPLTGKVSWNATGEFLQVLETAASTTVFATSQKGVISGNIAKFAVTFPANENTPLVYNAVYPASAWVTSSNTDITNMKVITPTVQQPTATSFDSNADLLIAKSISLKSQPTELQMSFGRAVAIGKMTVKNLASAESVLGVKFTAPDKKVTGRSYVDMTAGTIKEYGYINNFADNVTLNYSSEMNITANSEAGMTAYFTCFPFEVAAGETFTVTVTTASKIFTKTVTVQEGRTLAFAAGDSSTFAVDMTGATEEENETLSGDYVITATQSETTYAMSSLAEGSRLAPVVITPSNPYKTGDETLIWTITKSGDNYTISQGENYLSWESGNSATTSTTPYELVITKNKSEGTYQIASAATPSRILAKNDQAALGFGFYTGSQTKDLTLIPAEYVKLPEITLDQTTLTLSYNDTETHYIPVTLKNAETQDVSVAIYDGTEGTEQINVWSSSYGVNLGATTSDGYDNSKEFYARGHQIPNADRNGSDELVVQTYYATNSTPQIQNKFNGGIWQQLESGVRNITATTDTVYVVTGAILQTAGNHEAITWITPKSDSKRCPVPNYYYKALLKVRRDASNKVTSAMTIGFWMEHREYSNDSYTNYATSVAEIERLTGFDFFANLPADIQAAAEQNSNWNTFASF